MDSLGAVRHYFDPLSTLDPLSVHQVMQPGSQLSKRIGAVYRFAVGQGFGYALLPYPMVGTPFDSESLERDGAAFSAVAPTTTVMLDTNMHAAEARILFMVKRSRKVYLVNKPVKSIRIFFS